jgi:hypothetical protein
MTEELPRRVLWWVLVMVTLVGYVLAAPTAGTLQNATLIVPMAGYFVVGALVTRRRPGNPIGWIFLVTAAVSGVSGATNLLYTRAYESLVADPPPPGAVPQIDALTTFAAWVSSWLWFVLLYLATFLTFLLFPDGLPSRRWRPLLWLGSAGLGAVTVLAMLTPTLDFRGNDPEGPTFRVPNPVSPPAISALSDDALSQIEGAITVFALGCLVLSVASLFVRFRGATVMERAQLRWFALSATALLLSLPLQQFLPGGSDGTAGNLLFTVAATFVPVSCGIAILRYRLYDIDRVISRTLSYAVVTGMALATYAVLVTSASRLLPSGSSPLVVAGATLAAAALVRPLLRRVQRVVDRRFNRSRYDAERTVEEFGTRLRHHAEGAHVEADLLDVVRRSVDPSSTSLWIGGDTVARP